MNITSIKRPASGLLILSIFGVIGFSVYTQQSVSLVGSLFTLWAILPFVVLCIFMVRATLLKTVVTTTTLSILCALSLYFYYDSLFIHPDAQGALTFLFLPLYQLFAIALGFGVSAIVGAVKKDAATHI